MNDTVSKTVRPNHYKELCKAIDLEPINMSQHALSYYSDHTQLAGVDESERFTAAFNVLLGLVLETSHSVPQVDRTLLDFYIGKLDHLIGEQLDSILHHESFQALESSWLSLKYLVDRIDFRANIKLELLDIDKETLYDDFNDAQDITESGLYKQIYNQEYDMPGGNPISVMVSDFEFTAGAPDLELLSNLSKVAAAAHCPFLANVGPAFFGKQSMNEVIQIDDMKSYMEKAEFIRWHGFRETEDARYVGLCLPKFLLRLPYGEGNPVKPFSYREQVNAQGYEKFSWGNASFAFAANIARSFKRYGWSVNIRGPQAGGKVEALPMHQYDIGRGLQTKIPSQVLISETRELEFSDLGFIPLSYYKNSDYACFFSANSTQKSKDYTSSLATANARVNARLPYIFLASRIGHYLKVLQRENIGAAKDKSVLEKELNTWLKTLVTTMNDPDAGLIATHPLSEGRVHVVPLEDNPGYYSVSLHIKPHFQIEGMDVRLALVSKMPAAQEI